MDLPLLEADKSWKREFGQLMANEWLRKKLDRSRRLREHGWYLTTYMPELAHYRSGCMLDLGPGAGETLEIARHWGHNAIGLDSPTGEGGMGKAYVRACKMLHDRQKLSVLRSGLDGLLGDAVSGRTNSILRHAGEFCFINSRGSIEQMLSDCMDGVPHDRHHDCKRLSWRDDEATAGRVAMFTFTMADLLRVEGVLLIHMNGSANTEFGLDLFREAAGSIPELELVRDEERILKWRKRKPEKSESIASSETCNSDSGPAEELATSLGSSDCLAERSSDESGAHGVKVTAA